MKEFGSPGGVRVSGFASVLLIAGVAFAGNPPPLEIMKGVRLVAAADRGGAVVIPLGGGSSGVVSSINGLTGDVSLIAGDNVSVLNAGGNAIRISAAGGPGGATIVQHDDSLDGKGTADDPLRVTGTVIRADPIGAVYAADTTSGNKGAGVYAVFHTGTDLSIAGRTLSSIGAGVVGNSSDGVGVVGMSDSQPGVAAGSRFVPAIYGESAGDAGVMSVSTGAGKTGFIAQGGPGGAAAEFRGSVTIVGNVSKSGGSFKIDHPLDPEHKYLYHSFVESPDMMNVYNGNVTLDAGGAAVVELPEWFEALNREFRYQLTSIGSPQPGLYVAVEVTDNRFVISGGQPGGRVSWQVTGIRHDPWANAHRIPVEEDKAKADQGYYLHPALYGEPPERSIYRSYRLPGGAEK